MKKTSFHSKSILGLAVDYPVLFHAFKNGLMCSLYAKKNE